MAKIDVPLIDDALLLKWSHFLITNLPAKVNGKTYKKDGPDWVLELYNQWINNSDARLGKPTR